MYNFIDSNTFIYKFCFNPKQKSLKLFTGVTDIDKFEKRKQPKQTPKNRLNNFFCNSIFIESKKVTCQEQFCVLIELQKNFHLRIFRNLFPNVSQLNHIRTHADRISNWPLIYLGKVPPQSRCGYIDYTCFTYRFFVDSSYVIHVLHQNRIDICYTNTFQLANTFVQPFPSELSELNIVIACSTCQLLISITSQLSIMDFAILFSCESDSSLIFS